MWNSLTDSTVNLMSSHPPSHFFSWSYTPPPPSLLLLHHIFTPLSLVDAVIHHANTSGRLDERDGGADWKYKRQTDTVYDRAGEEREIEIERETEMRDWVTPAASSPQWFFPLSWDDGSQLASSTVVRQTNAGALVCHAVVACLFIHMTANSAP